MVAWPYQVTSQPTRTRIRAAHVFAAFGCLPNADASAPPEVYDDLHEYNLTSGIWTDLTQTIQGPLPAGRQSMGLDCVSDQLYLFGGQNQAGTLASWPHE